MNDCPEKKRQESRTLLLDIGNTHLKWAWAGRIHAGPPRVIAYRESDNHWFSEWQQGEQPRPGKILVANVAGAEIAESLSRQAIDLWGICPEFLLARERGWGVVNAYREPAALGVDRWLAMIAAQARGLTPACIFDCGTAVTADLIDGGGVHRGGLILPGLQMMREAIIGRTAIRVDEVPPPEGLLARDTAAAIALGGVQALVALAERLLEQGRVAIGTRPELLLTGGDAGLVQSRLEVPCRVEPDLVMSGLDTVAAGAC